MHGGGPKVYNWALLYSQVCAVQRAPGPHLLAGTLSSGRQGSRPNLLHESGIQAGPTPTQLNWRPEGSSLPFLADHMQVMYYTPFSPVRNQYSRILLQFVPPANSRVQFITPYSIGYEYFELVGGALSMLLGPALGPMPCSVWRVHA